jgi:hypothetical protein
MASAYALRIYNAAGALQFIVTDFRSLSYSKRVLSSGILKFEVDGDHAAAAVLDLDWQVEVWRRRDADTDQENEISWYRDFSGLYRDSVEEATDNGNTRFTAYCQGDLSLLERRIVAWPAGTANRSRFNAVAAESIGKTLVSYNAGTLATTGNSRLRDGTYTGKTINIQADGAAGNVIDWYCFGDNLLDSLRELSTVAGGDFDLVKTAATTWEFRWYAGQLGTNRSATVIFSLERGNMARPVLRRGRLSERTAAIVGGQGEQAERVFAVRTGANYDATDNNIETFVDASDVITSAGLNSRGDANLKQLQARDEITFDVLQVPATLYGRDYFLGDLVAVKYRDYAATRQILAVTVSWAGSGDETIAVEMGND